ncbi:unnamed protein product [Brachionus calyciflorus]|uniref:Uncharacterized protein n=1 Tax=Brachionus calyciflorus TaxID=104777 RepID=A0A813UZX3_9BILA|nr:unnamed protein product [Brachionus calyciflorus]
MKYIKSPYAQYLKKIKTSNPTGTSIRDPCASEVINHKQFKLVLPMVLKDKISGKGSSLKPDYPSPCGSEIKQFTECYNQYMNDVKVADEQAKKGIFKVEENQSKFPIKFMQKVLKEYKTPRKVDNGPDLPH